MSSDVVLVLAGPTGVGKTRFAIRLAQEFDAEIISADSRQIYRCLNLGTGKPSPAQRRQAVHHLISRFHPERVVTASVFADLAARARDEMERRGQRCILAGGTGLWIQAFMDGLTPSPPPDQRIRQELRLRAERLGSEALHAELERLDPETSRRIAPADRVRIIRALEIHAVTGRKPSQVLNRPAVARYTGCWIGLTRPRAELYAAAERRIDAWLEAGWLDEVRSLLARGIAPGCPAMQAIGYAHLVSHVSGRLDWPSAVSLIKRDTRRYIKRQLTWFKAEDRLFWIDLSRTGDGQALEMIRSKLAEHGWRTCRQGRR